MAKKHRNRQRKYRRLGGSGELPESSVQKEVEFWLKRYKWRWTHTGDSRSVRGHRGVPDIVALKGKVQLVVECKRKGGRFGPGQKEWLEAYREVGAVVMVVTPENLGNLVQFLRNVP